MAASREIGVPELAYRMGCSIPLAQSLIRTGRIPGRKTPRGWVTTLKAMEEYLSSHPRRERPASSEAAA